MDPVVQIVGALLILAAYAAAQFHYLEQDSLSYILLNLVGSAILTPNPHRRSDRGERVVRLRERLAG